MSRWEPAVLGHVRHGNVGKAVATYRQHGRIVTADTAEAIRDQLVADWWATREQGPGQTAVMVALHRTDVDDLNRRARERMIAAGHLMGPALHAAGVEFQAGDQIVCLRNDRRLGVVNGTQATVAAVTDDRGLVIVDRHDTSITLPASYLEAGLVAHGYAITGHKAQGLTVDHTFVLGSDALYREWGYVAMSRGRHTNRLYLHTTPTMEPDAHLPSPKLDPVSTTVRRLGRSGAHQPVSEAPPAPVVPLQRPHDRQPEPEAPFQWIGGRSR